MKKINIYSLYNKLLPSVKLFYKSFNYLDYSIEVIEKLLLNEIEKNMNSYTDDNNYCLLIQEKITNLLISKTKIQLENDDTAVDLLDKYINLNISFSSKYQTAIRELVKLGKFLSSYDYFPTPDVLDSLLKKNKTINKILACVVDKNKKNIINGNLDKIFEDSILISIIETYCLLNNINVIDNDFELNNDSYTDSLSSYYADIRNIEVLTREEENRLITLAKNGDETAKNKLIESNLRLVAAIARKYFIFGIPIQDLIQEGNIGLMSALNKFNPSLGIKYSTYAVFRIRQAIFRYILRKKYTFALSYYKAEKTREYAKKIRKLTTLLNHVPSNDEISEYLGISAKEIDEYKMIQEKPVSLNKIIGEEENIELGNYYLVDKDSLDKKIDAIELKGDLTKVFNIAQLDSREIYILKQRYGLDYTTTKTLEDLGMELNLTRERVRQLETRAINKIRKCPEAIEILSDYADRPSQIIAKMREYNLNKKNIYKKKIKK